MNATFTISATTPAGRTLTTTTDNPGAAFAAAKLFAEDHADPDAEPVQWQVAPDAPGLVEVLVRVDGGPTHLILLAPGQAVTAETALETCCAATLQLDYEQAEVYSVRGGARGIPCPLCHVTWAYRYQQLTDELAVSA